MRKTFSGYYLPTDDEFSELWDNCLFVLDANVLLGLYRYSPKTRDEIINIFKSIKDRLWVPHQAGEEYHRNRVGTIEGLKSVCEEIKEVLHKAENTLEGGLGGFRRRHPSVDPDHFIDKIKSTFVAIEKEIKMRKIEVPDRRKHDDIMDNITSLLEVKIGPSYSLEKLDEIYDEGKIRYKHKIPPGYKDAEKEGTKKYGDLVMWYQIIDKAEKDQKPIILITEETKEDWWQLYKSETIGPHPKLTEEIRDKAGVSFYMYRVDPFVRRAKEYFELEVAQDAIDEVQEVRKSDEERLKAAGPFSSQDVLNAFVRAMPPTETWKRIAERMTFGEETWKRIVQQLAGPEDALRYNIRNETTQSVTDSEEEPNESDE